MQTRGSDTGSRCRPAVLRRHDHAQADPGNLALLGIGGGVAAGPLHAPAPDTDHAAAEQPAADHQDAENCAPPAGAGPITAVAADAHGAAPSCDREYFEFKDQFVVPVIGDGRIVSRLVLSLSIEISPGDERSRLSARTEIARQHVAGAVRPRELRRVQGAYTKIQASSTRCAASCSRPRGRSWAKASRTRSITEIARQDA